MIQDGRLFQGNDFSLLKDKTQAWVILVRPGKRRKYEPYKNC